MDLRCFINKLNLHMSTTFKKPELIFGDQKSIDAVELYGLRKIAQKLAKTVKCPLCGAKNLDYWIIEKVWDSDEYVWGWDFDCEEGCLNSGESIANGNPGANLFTDKNGSFERGAELY